eukprot:5502467-Prymnesium_polylepis.1
MSDAVDGRSAARERKTIVRQKSLFYRSEPPRLAARHPLTWNKLGRRYGSVCYTDLVYFYPRLSR